MEKEDEVWEIQSLPPTLQQQIMPGNGRTPHGHGGDGLLVELDDLGGLFNPDEYEIS